MGPPWASHTECLKKTSGCTVFVDVEHRPRSDELQDSFNEPGKNGDKVGSDAARSTSGGEETPLHTSWEGVVAAANPLLLVVDLKGGKAQGLEGNKGRVALNC